MRDEDWWINTSPHMGWQGVCAILCSFLVVGVMLWLSQERRMLELTDYRLYRNVAKLMADVEAMKEYIRLLEQRIEKLEEEKK